MKTIESDAGVKTKLNGKKTILFINTLTVAVLQYSAGMLQLRKGQLMTMDRKTMKLTTINRAMHAMSDVDRIYLPEKK